MNVTVQIPDDLADALNATGAELSRRALEGLAIEEYKAGRLSRPQLRRLLGFETREELDGFLKSHDVLTEISLEELDRQMHDLHTLGL
jgi:hypothetical protein